MDQRLQRSFIPWVSTLPPLPLCLLVGVPSLPGLWRASAVVRVSDLARGLEAPAGPGPYPRTRLEFAPPRSPGRGLANPTNRGLTRIAAGDIKRSRRIGELDTFLGEPTEQRKVDGLLGVHVQVVIWIAHKIDYFKFKR